MAFTAVERMHFNNMVERILHVPGNYNGGILEMAIIFDCNLEKDALTYIGKEVAGILKTHSRVFQNVRLNVVLWESDDKLVKEISALPLFQMGRYFEEFHSVKSKKRLELLTQQLKKFYARSKLVILVTDGTYRMDDKEMLKEELQPFLYRRFIIISAQDSKREETQEVEIKSGMELLKGVL